MSLTELVQNLGVSDSTVRRDLEVLEEHGYIKRTHGGAIYVKDSHLHRLTADQETASGPQKQAIGAAVAAMIPDNATVVINGGTTCYHVARALQGRHVNVITNSVPVAALLSTDLATEVMLLGGYVYPRVGVALGATAIRMLDDLHASHLVLSCGGVTQQGAFNPNQMMVEVEQKMMGIADRFILAADHTKFNMRAAVKLCDLSAVGVLVTDAGLGPDTRAWLDKAGPRIVYADVPSSPPKAFGGLS